MALSHALAGAGHPPERISTSATVHLEKGSEGFYISRIELDTVGRVPGIDDATFQKEAEQAKKNCPISKVLKGADITLAARLER
jgi:osmotically inducible protein OsmC